MKSKKSAYILLPIVLIVWGIIFYRIYSGIDDNELISVNHAIPADLKIEMTPSEYSLFLNYNDPFLKNTVRILTSPETQSQKQSMLPKAKTAEDIKLPELQYTGMIRNAKNKHKIALLTIDQVSYMMKSGESQQNVTLLKVWNDSIQVEMGKKNFYIKRTDGLSNETSR